VREHLQFPELNNAFNFQTFSNVTDVNVRTEELHVCCEINTNVLFHLKLLIASHTLLSDSFKVISDCNKHSVISDSCRQLGKCSSVFQGPKQDCL